MYADDVSEIETAFVSYEYQVVMTMIYWLSWFVFWNGPRMSIATKSREKYVVKAVAVICDSIGF